MAPPIRRSIPGPRHAARDDEPPARRDRRWYEEGYEAPLTDYEAAHEQWRTETRARSGRPLD